MNKGFLTVALVLSLLVNIFLATKLDEQKSTDTGTITDTGTKQAQKLPSGESYPFIRVVDGDTITIGYEGDIEYVRLIGIDSPEPNDPGGPECYAAEATEHLKGLMETGTVTLFFDESQATRDKYNRLLAYVELPDSTDLGQAMLRDGYAREFTYDAPYDRIDSYKAAEQDASQNSRGLWSATACR